MTTAHGLGFSLDESARIRSALSAAWAPPRCPRCAGELNVTRGGSEEEICLVTCSPCRAFVLIRQPASREDVAGVTLLRSH